LEKPAEIPLKSKRYYHISTLNVNKTVCSSDGRPGMTRVAGAAARIAVVIGMAAKKSYLEHRTVHLARSPLPSLSLVKVIFPVNDKAKHCNLSGSVT